MTRLSLLTLEGRALPAGVNQLANGVVTVLGVPDAPNVIVADPVPGGVKVTLNGEATVVTGATGLILAGGRMGDDITNNTALTASLVGGTGDDMFTAGGGVETTFTGKGTDTVYDLLGKGYVVALNDGFDTVFVGPMATAVVDDSDRLVTFFKPGRTPGAGVVSEEGDVLYIAPPDGGSSVTLTDAGRGLVRVAYTFGDAVEQLYVTAGPIGYVAYFGGAGDDWYANDTAVDDVAYGSAGDDKLFGGRGAFSLLKGSGGNDFLVASAARADMTGNGGLDVFLGNAGPTVYRTDADDASFDPEDGDLVVVFG